jgi:hypothetical protein
MNEEESTGLPVRPPSSSGYTMRWAMIVPGLGVLILVIFIGAGFLTSNPVQPTKTSTVSHLVSGTPLRAVPAVDALSVITQDGQPPGNIINAVSIPAGAVRRSHQNNSAAADQYDEQIGLLSDDTQGALEDFYRVEMRAQGWQIFEVGPADHNPGAIEVLGKKAGSDGFYWEMGAVISATRFGAHAPPRGDTEFTVRLFQVPDPD